ncbi:hypothetical protein PCANC_11755 [Puccinia coronata f. sp. avenae]|uniref:Uncharacterized protein n=1 Tax=Puccinia coronata f. sp. avenae TaxID=200324 RepID=A0A2N5STJ7_9BASI|nr:hypothetical protein PCANC_15014 [Puccinia coronata f. sp. avenae]PLW42634.1 hypothetical protein PCANC_11755 [Puccinia coronata f. sp. avenae]
MRINRTTLITILLSIFIAPGRAVTIPKKSWTDKRPECLDKDQWNSKTLTLNERYDGIEFTKAKTNHLKLAPVADNSPGRIDITTKSKKRQYFVLEDLFSNSWLEEVVNKNQILTVDGHMLTLHLKKPTRKPRKTKRLKHLIK